MNAPSDASASLSCSEHVERRAGWACRDCLRRLCPECVATTEVRRTGYESCVHCDGGAGVLMVPGCSGSFLALLKQTLLMPVGLPLVLVGLGTWMLVRLADFSSGGAATWLLNGGLGLVGWASFLVVFQLSAKGPDLGTVQTLALREELLRPALRLWAVSVPFACALTLLGPLAPRLSALAVVAWGALVAPYLVLAASRGDDLRALARPRGPLALWRALGDDAKRLSGLFAGLLACLAWWWSVSRSAEASGMAMASVMLDSFVALGLLLSARLLGLLASMRADAWGVPFREDQRIPALPGARPLGVRRPKAPSEPPRERPAFLEL